MAENISAGGEELWLWYNRNRNEKVRGDVEGVSMLTSAGNCVYRIVYPELQMRFPSAPSVVG